MSFMPIDPRPATEDDLRLLMRRLAALDGHRRSVDDVETWLIVMQTKRWTCAEVVAGMLRILADFTGFIVTPGHLTTAIDACRAEVRHGWNPPAPPRELADDPEREIRWRRNALADYRARAMVAVASGDDLRNVPMIAPRFTGRPELPAASPGGQAERDARAAVDAFVARSHEAMREMPMVALPRATRPSVVDPVRARDARAELAATRPGPLPFEHEAGPVVDAEVVDEAAPAQAEVPDGAVSP